ncbi:hypothetical protein Tco_0873260 [Tanacetum coccineum]
MKGRLRSWMELVLALQVKDNQFSEPHTWDHNESGFLLSLSVLCQILFVFREGVDGLSEFFPHPFRIIDMSSIDDAPKNLQHWSSWPFKPRSLSRKAQIDDCRECPLRLRGRKSLVVVDWCDLESISECVFSKVEPLLIQLTLVTPVDSVIANSIPELLNIDSWYCRRGGKRSEEVAMFQNVHRNLVDWVALRLFSI